MKISKTLQKRIDKALSEKVEIVPYNPAWPKIFAKEAKFLNNKFPEIIKRIEHFGSTAVSGLSAKPIVDMLVEVKSLKEVKKKIVPVLKALGYDYFWRPEFDKPPMYAWFIKRDSNGNRTHHIHIVEGGSRLWERLSFRDYLRKHPKELKLYEKLKLDLSRKYTNDREAYTKEKTKFVVSITQKTKRLSQV